MENEFDYRKYLNLLLSHKRLFAVAALTIMSGAVVLSYILPKKYESQSTFFVEKNVLSDLVSGNTSRNNETQDALKGLNYAIISRSLLIKVINDLDLNLKQYNDSQLESFIMGLQKRTDVNINAKEGLITVSFVDKSPRLARDYVNALVRRYLEENLSSKREESYGATSFLSDQVASSKMKLDKIDTEIAGLRAKYGVALDIPPGSIQMDNGAGLQRLDDLILRRAQLEATRNQLRSNNPAKNRLAALQRRLEELRVEYTDNYPEVIKVKADIEAARQEANSGSATVTDHQELARVEAELSAVRASEASQRALNRRGIATVNPTARASFDSLMQEKISLRATYDQLMARQNQAEMSKQMAVQDKTTIFRIVDPAVLPLFPKSPNRMKIILIGIAAGLVGGFALLMAIDYFDKSVKSVDTLKALGVNVLAVIPKISDPQAIVNERRRDLRLYLVSGTYFSMIVALLALELLGMSPVEMIVGMIQG
jgi:polysaccharide chain length determinant protein (PEP-CTERM system associated)